MKFLYRDNKKRIFKNNNFKIIILLLLKIKLLLFQIPMSYPQLKILRNQYPKTKAINVLHNNKRLKDQLLKKLSKMIKIKLKMGKVCREMY